MPPPPASFPAPGPPACTSASRARCTDPFTTWLTKVLSMAAILAARSAQTVALGTSRHASIVSKRGLRSGRPLGPLAGSLHFGGGSLGQAMFLRTEARRQARVAVVSTAGPWVYACGLGRPLGVAAAPAPLPPAMLTAVSPDCCHPCPRVRGALTPRPPPSRSPAAPAPLPRRPRPPAGHGGARRRRGG